MKKQLHFLKKSSIAAALLFFSFAQANVPPEPCPTLSTVTAATACAGSRTNIILSGLVPNSVNTVRYTVGGGPNTNISVTATANGTFSFQTPVLGPDQNGLIIRVKRITNSDGCVKLFGNKSFGPVPCCISLIIGIHEKRIVTSRVTRV